MWYSPLVILSFSLKTQYILPRAVRVKWSNPYENTFLGARHVVGRYSINDSWLSSWILAVNESGFLEDWKSILQLPLVKKSLFLFEKQTQKHPRPRPLQWGRWLPLQWALYFPSRRVLHPDLICPITPSAHKLLRPLQHTHRVFEDGLYWVREQKVLNYLYKWQGRNTLFPFGSRM